MEEDALDRLFGEERSEAESTQSLVDSQFADAAAAEWEEEGEDGEEAGRKEKEAGQEEEGYDDIFGEEEGSDDDDDKREASHGRHVPSEASGALEASADEETFVASEKEGRSRKRTLSDVRVREMTIRRLQAPRDLNLRPALLKLPAFMGIQAQEYSPEAVLEAELGDVADGGNGGEDSAAASQLLRAATTVRWRQGDDAPISNARLVQWSDGSWSLVLGDSVYFELSMQGIPSEQHFVFGRHPEEGAMECLGKLEQRLMLRPYITEDQAHRRYLAAAATTAAKVQTEVRVKMAVTTVDPELEKARMIKLEAEKLKARRKLEARRRNLKQSSLDRVSRTGLTARFLEEEDFEEEATAGEEDQYEDDFIDDNPIEEPEEEDDDDDDDEASDDDASPDSGAGGRASDVRDAHPQEPTPKKSRRVAIVDDDDDDDERNKGESQ